MVPGGAVRSELSPNESAVGENFLAENEELVLNEPVPLSVPKPPEPPRLVAEPKSVPAPEVEPKPTPKVEAKREPKLKPEPKAEAKAEVKAEPKPKAEAKSVVSDAERARALLEGRAPSTGTATSAAPAKVEASKQGRLIVQVGAFADAAKASEVRGKLDRAGLKTFTQVIDTKDGKRTRVRVGPFDQRDDADKAAARIRALGLSASVLTL